MKGKIKLTLIGLILISIIILIYNIIFSPYFVNNLIKKIIQNNLKEIEIHFDCKDISLFRGIELDNIHIYDKISQTSILELKKLKIKYFLPAFLNGDIGIREISLIEPNIYLYKINNRWNFESLIPSEKKIPDKDNEKELTNIKDFINLYVPVRLFFYFNIKKLNFYYKDIKQLDISKNAMILKEQLEIKDLSLYTGFITKTFHKIPLDYKIINLIDDFIFYINPDKPLMLYYQKNQEVTGQPIIKIALSKIKSKRSFFF
ncbi:MAG: hypothetical protein KatS3mg129_2108 [Leptospiraceae bacterium]|nr:MAG: hypothetical protein KatS3mg129_2108 [Leptospiraceae bacterium]